MRAFLADPAHGAGAFRLIPVLRARVTGVSGRETQLESFEDVRARGSLAREYTVTYRDHLEANERIVDGAVLERPVDRSRSLGREGHPRALSDRRRRHDALRHPRPHRQRARHEHPRGGLARLAQRRVHVRVPARACSRGAADLHLAAQGPGRRRRRARRFQHDLVAAVSERLGHRLPRDPGDDPRHHVEGDAGDHRRRRPGAVQRRADSRRRRGDDEVPARLRGGGLQDARREHPHDRPDAAVRVRRARAAGRARSGRWARSALTWGVSRYALEIPWRVVAGEHVGGVGR